MLRSDGFKLLSCCLTSATTTQIPISIMAAVLNKDSATCVKKKLKAIDPKVVIIAETEIWPNFINLASKESIPMVMVNGRMSEKSFGNYKLLKNGLGKILSKYQKLFLKSEQDKKRYSYFGVENIIEVAGDIKADAPLKPRTEKEQKEIYNRFNLESERRWLVAGSTRPGEGAHHVP